MSSLSVQGRAIRARPQPRAADRGGLELELGVDAQRRESPMLGGASNGVLGRVTIYFTNPRIATERTVIRW